MNNRYYIQPGLRANFRHQLAANVANFGLISESTDWAMKGLSGLNRRAGQGVRGISDNLMDYAGKAANQDGFRAKASRGLGDTIGRAGTWIGDNADTIRNAGLIGLGAGGVAGGVALGTRQRQQPGY